MKPWLDAGDYAGMSAALALYFAISSASLGYLIWRDRDRFLSWRRLSTRDRSDVMLHVALFGIAINAALRRIVAGYNFALNEWRAPPAGSFLGTVDILWSLAFVTLFMRWLAMEIFGIAACRAWWISSILSGVALGAFVCWRY